MYDWEAKLIEHLNEVRSDWRDHYPDAETAAMELAPDFPGLAPPPDVMPDDLEPLHFDEDYDYGEN